MSISPEAFNLTDSMIDAWQDAALEDEQKQLISACLPENVTQPTSEQQLATLQGTVNACEILLSVGDTGSGHWLSEEGRKFPDAVYKLTYLVARKMHLAEHKLGEQCGKPCCVPEDFFAPFVQKVKDTQSHVATLNYDGLLSSALREAGVLEGSNPILFDGFVSSKFNRTNLFRKKNFGGWYLHLHGSPLFAGSAGQAPRKLAESTIRKSTPPKNVGRHVVLTHFRHKPKIISSSEVLSIYWEFLQMAIDESEEIVIFGYSGNDIHLNRIISQQRTNKNVKVVDWLGSGSTAVRTSFWSEQLGGPVDLRLLEDVLTFSDW